MSEAPAESTRPEPDEFGRYRVINEVGHEYSTLHFVEGAHKIAEGPASLPSGHPVPPVPAAAPSAAQPAAAAAQPEGQPAAAAETADNKPPEQTQPATTATTPKAKKEAN